VTASQIIDDLGGTQVVADRIGVDKRVVSNWRARGISALATYKIFDLAKRQKYVLPPGFERGKTFNPKES
jgi:hypothetical protein